MFSVPQSFDIGQQVRILADNSSGVIVAIDPAKPYPFTVQLGNIRCGRTLAKSRMSFAAAEILPVSDATPETFVNQWERDMQELEAAMIEQQLHDAIHCRECGKVAAGCIIAGSHVQACDSCIVEYVQQQIAPMFA